MTEKEKKENDRMARWVLRHAMEASQDRDGFSTSAYSTKSDTTGYGGRGLADYHDPGDDDEPDDPRLRYEDDDDDDSGPDDESGGEEAAEEAGEAGEGAEVAEGLEGIAELL